MSYKNAADALLGLVMGKEKDAERVPWKLEMTEPSRMLNGLDYFFVEVTFGNGTQYGIPAYGEEAHELRQQALVLKEYSKSLIAPIVVR